MCFPPSILQCLSEEQMSRCTAWYQWENSSCLGSAGEYRDAEQVIKETRLALAREVDEVTQKRMARRQREY